MKRKDVERICSIRRARITFGDLSVRERLLGIGLAEGPARDRLDEERNKRTEKKVVKLETHIRGRELESREQLHGIFRELEERIGPLLDQGDRVRIW